MTHEQNGDKDRTFAKITFDTDERTLKNGGYGEVRQGRKGGWRCGEGTAINGDHRAVTNHSNEKPYLLK